MNKNEKLRLIKDSLESSQYKWRTPRGVSKETGLKFSEVLELLEKSPQFQKAKKPNKRGEPLFTTREKYKKQSSPFTRIISALTNEGGL
ncbi:hypothetical protein [Planctobacterium marinum]|uniref:hypothetical protein n=1 Tax=Planctobacterium marinum TaxID=1631968 RepID=UPI001E34E9FE|nr:hypothetical protein [Planctobacterium marinum]MCC2607999.1 hypothetical protein [Planctobacterium marinum]